jgi:hypothetical protein
VLAAAVPLEGPAEATSVVITPTDTLVTNNANTKPLIARNPACGSSASSGPRAGRPAAGPDAR